jgi:hypothetical protein
MDTLTIHGTTFAFRGLTLILTTFGTTLESKHFIFPLL